jgi:hypothetical protein
LINTERLKTERIKEGVLAAAPTSFASSAAFINREACTAFRRVSLTQSFVDFEILPAAIR